jgi:hypothetical protein
MLLSIDNAATRDDHDKVFQMIMASLGSQVVRTLALMSVAEHLHGAALTAEEIAVRESSDPALTYRLLRAGAALGFLEYRADTGQFTGTSLLGVLREDSPLSLKHYAQAAAGPAFWLTNMLMPETVMEGSTRVVDALGSSVFEHFAEHQDQAREFSAAMTNLSTPVIREAVTAMDTGMHISSSTSVARTVPSSPRSCSTTQHSREQCSTLRRSSPVSSKRRRHTDCSHG